MGKAKRYWLLKTEPSEWSWSDQDANGGISKWDGVKNKTSPEESQVHGFRRPLFLLPFRYEIEMRCGCGGGGSCECTQMMMTEKEWLTSKLLER
ncbi:hypothetical protein HID58_095235 [Brassica napus]|uniref:EVE domain-containing protein n=1 Tax=Brassica napus TaxID=3708 RepID=A0ABQ7X4E8_BRANA|nr:hypothetical protein HID58_095235 [Brassica napus]